MQGTVTEGRWRNFLFLSVVDFRATKYLTSLEEKPGNNNSYRPLSTKGDKDLKCKDSLYSISSPNISMIKAREREGDEVGRGFGVLQHRQVSSETQEGRLRMVLRSRWWCVRTSGSNTCSCRSSRRWLTPYEQPRRHTRYGYHTLIWTTSGCCSCCRCCLCCPAQTNCSRSLVSHCHLLST